MVTLSEEDCFAKKDLETDSGWELCVVKLDEEDHVANEDLRMVEVKYETIFIVYKVISVPRTFRFPPIGEK